MTNWQLFVSDCLVIVAAAVGAFTLTVGGRLSPFDSGFQFFLLIALGVKLPIFAGLGMYRRVWRYASIDELLTIAGAVLVSAAGVLAVATALQWAGSVVSAPRAVAPVDALLTLIGVGALRLSARVRAETWAKAEGAAPKDGHRPVLVVGAGDAGVMVVRELQRNRQLGMTAIGFLDDDPMKVSKRILNLPILGRLNQLVTVARSHGVREVLIAMPSASGTVVRALASSCREAGLASRTIPGVFELLDGQATVSRLRKIDILDLLRRAPIAGDSVPNPNLSGRCVLVTGAGGSIGSELCRQVAAARPARLVLLGHGENSLFDVEQRLREAFPNLTHDVVVADVRDKARICSQFEAFRPSVVFHAAAHKHVPLMETNPEEAISNNVLGTRNIVDAALAVGVERLVMISTDKAVAPSSMMGASKRVAECIVRTAAARHGVKFVVVRFGNVLGSRGSVVPHFKQQIENGGPVTVTHPDMRRFFMTIPEAVHLVLQAGGIGTGGELFVLDMGAPVRILDLARDLITLSGLQPSDIPIVFTGMRPGEKLEETLWEHDATVQQTLCPNVLCVTEPDLCRADQLEGMIDALLEASRSRNRPRIDAELRRWIPSSELLQPVSGTPDE